jgi:hypothetical protein
MPLPNVETARPVADAPIHALLVGVSHYRHLPGGGGTDAPETFNLEQLESPALSAYRIYEWLVAMDRAGRLPGRLASVRLLLSPSPRERPEIPAPLLGRGATLDELQTAATEWRNDLRNCRHGMALCFFAGHGMQLSEWDSALLLEDFGDGKGGNFHKAVSVSNLYYGMAPGPKQPDIAQAQLYFVDACRVYPDGTAGPTDRDPPSTVFAPVKPGLDDRRAPLFYSAVPGAKAGAIDLEPTIFTQALLRCLAGAGAEFKQEPDWTERWRVSSHSLAKAVAEVMQDVQAQRNLRHRQECRVSGNAADVELCTFDEPPQIEVRLHVEPDDARPHARVLLERVPAGACVLDPVDDPVPHLCARVAPGRYRLGATIGPPPLPPYQDFAAREFDVVPPLVRRNLRMTP